MSAHVLLAIALAAFAILRFVVEPNLAASARSFSKERRPSAIVIAKLAAARFLGTFFMCTALGAGVAHALTVWVESIDVAALEAEATPQALESVASLLGFLANSNEVFSKIGLIATITPIALLGIGLLYWSIRSTRGVESVIQREVADLREKQKKEGLESLPDDGRMLEVRKRIELARERGEDTEALYQLLYELDLVRRVDPSLLRKVGLQAPSKPLWLRVVEFMISGTVHKGMSRVAAAAAVSATVLLVPASLVFTSQGLGNAVAQATKDLEDARRNITLAIAGRNTDTDLRKAIAQSASSETGSAANPVPPNAEATENSIQSLCDAENQHSLSAADCRTAARFGRAFEAEWASQFHSRSAPDAQQLEPTQSTRSAESVARARREWARERVLIETVRARTTPSVDVIKTATSDEGRWERIVLDAELTSRTESRPVTPVGRNAEFRLREVLRLQPGSVTVSNPDAPLSLRELAGRAASGAISAFVDLSGIEGWSPDIGGKALSGALTAGASTFFEEKIIRPSDAEYLVKASDVAAKSIVVDALRSGEIGPQSMNVLGQFVDSRTARRLREPLGQATTLQFEKLPSTLQAPTLTLGARPDPHMDRSAVEDVLRQSASAGRALAAVALSSYDGIFPSLRGQAALTQEAMVLRAVDRELADRQFGPPPSVVERTISPAPPHTELPRRPEPASGDVPPTRPPVKHPPGSGPMELTIRMSPSETTGRARIARAHSYSRLRGFARVGGVLIGRDPETSIAVPKIDIIDFHFSISPMPNSDLMLEVEHGDGTRVMLGPYNPAIAHFALAYAADGRPTTVSMISAEPLHDLKVLLHPALVDTGLGCRAIRLDQFVDEFGWHEPGVGTSRKQASDEHHGLIALFRKAWAERFFAVTTALEPELSFERLEESHNRKLEEYSRIVDSINQLRSSEVARDLRDILGVLRSERELEDLKRELEDLQRRAERSSIFSGLVSEFRPLADSIKESKLPLSADVALNALRGEPARLLQPLRERPEYFDSSLLNVLERCAATISAESDPTELSNCVRMAVTALSQIQLYRHSEHFSWLAPPPQIVTWSGVRERPYELDKELNFAKVTRDPKEGPLRFIIQNAMPNRPLLTKSDTPWYLLSDDETGLVPDIEPWELTELEDALHDAIHKGISDNPEALSVLMDFTEFTVLQRLFRAVFDGRLGLRFPIEKFSHLARDTGAHINPKEIRTPRWNPRPCKLEAAFFDQFVIISTRAADLWTPSLKNDIRKIVKPCEHTFLLSHYIPAIDSILDRLEEKAREAPESSPLHNRHLEKAAELDGLIAQFNSTSRLREALGISEDWDIRFESRNACPVP